MPHILVWLFQLLGKVVDREGRNQRTILALMASTPRYQLGNVIAGYLGQELILAEKVHKEGNLPPRIVSAGMVLPGFGPVAAGYIVNSWNLAVIDRHALRVNHIARP